VVPVPGTKEAFEAYLQLKPDGKDADAARAMLASMDASIQTQYVNPDAPKKKTSSTQKKK
jgi:hypothetical protein